MDRIEELNSKEYDILIVLRNSIENSGRKLLSERINDFIISNSLLIRDQIPGDNFRMKIIKKY